MTEPRDIKTWLGWALAASLGANLFLGGFVVARSLSQNSGEDLPQLVDVVLPRGIPQGLPVELRERLEDQVRVHKVELKDVYRDYARSQRRIGRLLAAEDFDTEALEQEYKLLRELGVRMQVPIQEAVIAVARETDVASRRMIIELQGIDDRTIRFLSPDRLDGKRWKFQRDGEGFQFFIGSDDSEDRTELEVLVEENDDE